MPAKPKCPCKCGQAPAATTRVVMTTPNVTPAQGPVITAGARVYGQMYYVPDDLFVIRAGCSYEEDRGRYIPTREMGV